MWKLLENVRKTKYGTLWLTAFLLGLLPILCAVCRCAMDGKTILDIYLPACEWNDELFYYKLVDGVLKYGYPQGYFGFNESHALKLSFAAWTPVLLTHWVIWGMLFGWNLISPMLANIAVLSIALFIFAILVRPNRKQSLFIALLYMSFTSVTRFSLSCIPEAEIWALTIIFIAVALACRREYRAYRIFILYMLVALLTWMRPYLLLLWFTPLFLSLMNRKGKTLLKLVIGAGAIFLTMLGYWSMNHYLSAPYLTDLFYTDWIRAYFERGLFGGLRYTVWKLVDSMRTVIRLINYNVVLAAEKYSAAGLYYLIFLILLAITTIRILYLLVGMWRRWKRHPVKAEGRGAEKCDDINDPMVMKADYSNLRLYCEYHFPEFQWFLCMWGFFAADLLMYRIQEGGRHTLVYILGWIVMMPVLLLSDDSNRETDSRAQRNRTMLFAGLVIIFLLVFVGRGNIDYEYALPYGDDALKAEIASLAEQLEQNIELEPADIPSYDNVVIWTYWDSIGEESRTVDYGLYYAVPGGFGINLCDGGYLDANLENLKCRYIGVLPDGELEKRARKIGAKEVARGGHLVIYQLY